MTIGRCDSCDSRLAHDQRYCLECGARRGALPHYVAASIAGILERGERIVARRAPRRETAAPGFEPDPTRWHEIWLRAPRAAAATVIATLSFGGLIGSLVGNSAAGTASQVIVAMAPGTHAASAGGGAGSVAGGGGDGGGVSGGPATITVTTPAPSTPAPSGSGVGGGATTPTTGATTPVNTGLPPIKHVFLVMLSQEGYNQTFGASSSDPYLARTLTHQGELVPNYYAVAGSPLANEIALVSGQGPTPSTEADCPLYQQVLPGSAGRRGQVVGDGCEYPAQTQTLASQLNAVHLATKTYVQPAGPAAKVPRAESCRPGFAAPTSAPSVKKPYAAWQNPFLYFTPSGPTKACSPDVAGIAQLRKDLRSAKTTPALSYIVPNLCDDGAMACQPQPKTPVQAMDRFLQTLVPEIKHSPAYKHGGVIVITFDEAPQTGQYTDPSSCCNNPKYPNLKGAPPPGPGSSSSPTGTTTGATTTDTSTTDTTTTGTTTTPTTPTSSFGGQTNPTGGGGHVGLLLISRYVTPGTLEVTDYFNHFSLLASLEDVFALKRLGYASVPTLPVFGAAVWNNYKPH